MLRELRQLGILIRESNWLNGLLVLPVALAMAGCGPGHKPTNIALKGRVALGVTWPSQTTRSVLLDSQSLVVTLDSGEDAATRKRAYLLNLPSKSRQADTDDDGSDDGGGDDNNSDFFPQTKTLNRPDTQVVFDEVPVGPAVVMVQAFSEEDGEGTVIGTGSASVVVSSGTTTQVQLTLTPGGGGGGNGDTGTVEVIITDGGSSGNNNGGNPPSPRQTFISISLDPARDRYARGDKVNIVVRLYSPGNIPITNASIRLYREWHYPNSETWHEAQIGTLTTGSDGKVIKAFTIPNSNNTPPEQDVRLRVEFDGNDVAQPHVDRLWRIPIGTS